MLENPVSIATEVLAGTTDEILGDIDFHGFIRKAEDGDNLSHTVRTVVEEEKGIAIYNIMI